MARGVGGGGEGWGGAGAGLAGRPWPVAFHLSGSRAISGMSSGSKAAYMYKYIYTYV